MRYRKSEFPYLEIKLINLSAHSKNLKVERICLKSSGNSNSSGTTSCKQQTHTPLSTQATQKSKGLIPIFPGLASSRNFLPDIPLITVALSLKLLLLLVLGISLSTDQ